MTLILKIIVECSKSNFPHQMTTPFKEKMFRKSINFTASPDFAFIQILDVDQII